MVLFCSKRNLIMSKEQFQPSWDSLKTHVYTFLVNECKIWHLFSLGDLFRSRVRTKWYLVRLRYCIEPTPLNIDIMLKLMGIPQNSDIKILFHNLQWKTLIPMLGRNSSSMPEPGWAHGQHHDGFSMWDSKINPWNAVAMGPHQDIVGDIRESH